MENFKISVIIPIYNTEKYLGKCLDSIINQTYLNLEIILIDDGSKDESFKICSLYQNKDKRIKVITQENQGASYVRKRGVEISTGDYIMFVDSDDWLEKNAITKCVEAVKIYDVECVMFSYIKEYENKSIPNYIWNENFILSDNKVWELIHRRLIGPVKEELKNPEKLDNLSSVCMKLYKTDIVKSGKWVDIQKIGTSEDTLFNIYAFEKCSKVAYLNECFYHYRKTNEESIITGYKKDLPERWDSLYQIMKQYIVEGGFADIYKEAYYNRIACGIIGLSLNEIHSGEHFLKQAKRLKNILNKKEYIKALNDLKTEYMPVKWKIYFGLCKYKCFVILTFMVRCIQILKSKVAS